MLCNRRYIIAQEVLAICDECIIIQAFVLLRTYTLRPDQFSYMRFAQTTVTPGVNILLDTWK